MVNPIIDYCHIVFSLNTIDHIYSKTPFDTTLKRLTLGSIRKGIFINSKSETITSGVEGLPKSLIGS